MRDWRDESPQTDESFVLCDGPNVDGHESYELRDYTKFKGRKDVDDRERRRQEKRDRKRRWLEAQDEMKFSHSIQFNAVPDWSSHYIAYSNLKKL